ncbi:flagellar biosynthesis protein FlgA [Jiangella aurantiaca]|uniref:Flagellar biosynthesis protein FlgA n=1 Tax=Jiangella aurantiaca TaxID=2530373 RepID=A0A4R5AAC8_9ACTN|nr:SAF domain-containing protein [Jiangella aurantiaca]TDD69258.1 flagellar biosynthesis protein FlgA [Jiangella aurantiaca]
MAGTTQTTDAANERQRAREQRGIRSNQRVRVESARLPSPPRQRRPALAALAVLLIVGGAAVAALLAMRVDERTPVLVVTEPIAAGERITEAKLSTTQVAAEGTELIPESDLEQALTFNARVNLQPGQLLDTQMLTDQPPLGEGQVAVGAFLGQGFLPAGGLQAGDIVDLVSIVTGEGETVVEGARVASATAAEGADQAGGTGSLVTLLVDRGDAATVGGLAATSQLVVTLVERGVPFESGEE